MYLMASLPRNKRWLFIVAIVLAALFAVIFSLTKEKYRIMKTADMQLDTVHKILHAYQKLSNDFKSAIIYNPQLKTNGRQHYYQIFEKGEHEISADLAELKTLIRNPSRLRQLDTLETLITNHFNAILNNNLYDTIATGKKSDLVEKVVEIQHRIDRGQFYAEERSLKDVSYMQGAVSAVYNWLLTVIITSAGIITASLAYVIIQVQRREKIELKHLEKIELQNKRLKEIAWIQSHKVRSPVANILGLSQLFDRAASSASINEEVISKVVLSARQLDTIINEIDDKTKMIED